MWVKVQIDLFGYLSEVNKEFGGSKIAFKATLIARNLLTGSTHLEGDRNYNFT